MAEDRAQSIDLRQAASEATAGELTPGERAAFAELAAADPTLRQDCEFWSALRSGLAVPPVDPAWAPGPRFCDVLRARHAREQQRAPMRAVMVSTPRWLGLATAACLGIAIGWLALPRASAVATAPVAIRSTPASRSPSPSSSPAVSPTPVVSAAPAASDTAIAYQDDGGTVQSPALVHVNWGSYMPLTAVKQVDEDRPPGQHATEELSQRPWLGMWTKPVALRRHNAPDGYGHMVLAVVSHSPADAAGLRPGDVILAIDHCPVVAPCCIADHLVKAKPGDSLDVQYWSAKTATVSEIRVTLGSLSE